MRFDKLVTPGVQRRMLEVARELRKEPQPSEQILWGALRRKRLRGLKFRRQQPIGPFVVDFYCDAVGLVIEVDGPIHLTRREADRRRQELLEELELKVARVAAADVESNLSRVLARIEAALAGCVPLAPGERG